MLLIRQLFKQVILLLMIMSKLWECEIFRALSLLKPLHREKEREMTLQNFWCSYEVTSNPDLLQH